MSHRDVLSRLVKKCLPYGKYILEDGSEVYFNRDYQPIWKVCEDGKHEAVLPNQTIEWVKQEHFYDDGNPPLYSAKTLDKCMMLFEEHFRRRFGKPKFPPQTPPMNDVHEK